MTMKPTGILCSNIVPYNADHSINKSDLRRYVAWLDTNAS
jgi:dihydrodipicolinate synthase/N-acetylneuraminate lyase